MSRRGRPSLAKERHDAIVSHLRRAGSARVADLAELLEVSEMTIRRDLDSLDQAGAVRKVHGGATARFPRRAEEPGFDVKRRRNVDEKIAIAAAAAGLTGAGAAIGITAGTTTVRLADELLAVPDLTVVTNSIPVADAFHAHRRPDRTVILVGGERTPSDALVGPVAVSSLRAVHLDIVFMGVHGIHERAGFTTPNLSEADTNKAFAASTESLVVLADHTKWGVTGLATIAELSDAAVCVTDDALPDHAAELLRARVGRLIVTHPNFVTDSRSA